MVDHRVLFKKWNSGEFGSLFILNSSWEKHIRTLAFLCCNWEATNFLIPSGNCVTILCLKYGIDYADGIPENMKQWMILKLHLDVCNLNMYFETKISLFQERNTTI